MGVEHRKNGKSENVCLLLFSQCFSTCAFAEDWDPRSALGVPLGPMGFARERTFPETFVFTTFLNGFWETLAGGRPLPRGVFTTLCGLCLFLQGFRFKYPLGVLEKARFPLVL